MLDRLVTPTDARAPRTYGISLVGPHTRAFEAEHKTNNQMRRKGQWLRGAAGSDDLPDGPPPSTWEPARPESPGVYRTPLELAPHCRAAEEGTVTGGDKRQTGTCADVVDVVKPQLER